MEVRFSHLEAWAGWTRHHGLRVHHPKYGLLPTKLIGNTPVLREAEALQLIADMEQVEMDKLEANVTEGAIRTLSVDEAPATWLDHLGVCQQRGAGVPAENAFG